MLVKRKTHEAVAVRLREVEERLEYVEERERRALERHQADRAAWAQAAAQERQKLLDDAAAERAGLIGLIADLKGAQATPMLPWPDQLPVLHRTEADEISEADLRKRQEVADAIQAELDARVAHDLGTETVKIPVTNE